jgi:hypothetical protein
MQESLWLRTMIPVVPHIEKQGSNKLPIPWICLRGIRTRRASTPLRGSSRPTSPQPGRPTRSAPSRPTSPQPGRPTRSAPRRRSRPDQAITRPALQPTCPGGPVSFQGAITWCLCLVDQTSRPAFGVRVSLRPVGIPIRPARRPQDQRTGQDLGIGPDFRLPTILDAPTAAVCLSCRSAGLLCR